MNKRKVLVALGAVAILVAAFLLSNILGTPKEKPNKAVKKDLSTVFVQAVLPSANPIFVETTGRLSAKNRIDLYSEVQGVMLPDGGRFRTGNSFAQGQLLISMESQDRKAAVVAQRSRFQSNLSAVLPDIRVDYPNDFEAWNRYLLSISVDKNLPKLPEVSNENLKAFLTGRGIYSEYYNVVNAEISLAKFNIYAPFSGVLVSANVDPGTVIRQGQLLGRFIQPGTYELECQVNVKDLKFLSKGQKVELNTPALPSKQWDGKIIRINNAIDPNSQMCSVIIAVEADQLKDGMFITARLQAKNVEESISIPRSGLVNSNHVFVVEQGKLKDRVVEVVYRGEQQAVIKGLEKNQKVLTKIPPGAFEGMEVKVYQSK